MNIKMTLGLILTGLILIINSVAAGDKTLERSELPKQYNLDEVSFSVLHQTGHRLPGSYKIEINGDGKASQIIDQDKENRLFLQKEQLVELLNDFYHIHFFELQDNWTTKRSVSLLDDNLISTFGHRIVDMSSQRLCIQIADYKKCVTVMDEQPFDAHTLVKKIEALFPNKSIIQ